MKVGGPKIAPTAPPSSDNMVKTKGVPNKTYATRKQAKNAYNAKQDRLARDGLVVILLMLSPHKTNT